MSGQAADWQAVRELLSQIPGVPPGWSDQVIAILGNCDNPFAQTGPSSFGGPLAGTNPQSALSWAGPTNLNGGLSIPTPKIESLGTIPDVEAAILALSAGLQPFLPVIGVLDGSLATSGTTTMQPIGGGTAVTVHSFSIFGGSYPAGSQVIALPVNNSAGALYVYSMFPNMTKGIVTAAIPHRDSDVGLGAGIGTANHYVLNSSNVEVNGNSAFNGAFSCRAWGVDPLYQIRVDDEITAFWMYGAWYAISSTHCPDPIP